MSTLEKITRLVSLSVGVSDSEGYARTYEDLSDLARELSKVHDYVNLTTQIQTTDVDEIEECPYHDEETITKVKRALLDSALTIPQMEYAFAAMQNAGILFRERGKR